MLNAFQVENDDLHILYIVCYLSRLFIHLFTYSSLENLFNPEGLTPSCKTNLSTSSDEETVALYCLIALYFG